MAFDTEKLASMAKPRSEKEKNEIIQGNNLPKIEKIQGNNFLLSDKMH